MDEFPSNIPWSESSERLLKNPTYVYGSTLSILLLSEGLLYSFGKNPIFNFLLPFENTSPFWVSPALLYLVTRGTTYSKPASP